MKNSHELEKEFSDVCCGISVINAIHGSATPKMQPEFGAAVSPSESFALARLFVRNGLRWMRLQTTVFIRNSIRRGKQH